MYHGRTRACMHCVPLFLPGNKDVAGIKNKIKKQSTAFTTRK